MGFSKVINSGEISDWFLYSERGYMYSYVVRFAFLRMFIYELDKFNTNRFHKLTIKIVYKIPKQLSAYIMYIIRSFGVHNKRKVVCGFYAISKYLHTHNFHTTKFLLTN
jgi:hypothetical protein